MRRTRRIGRTTWARWCRTAGTRTRSGWARQLGLQIDRWAGQEARPIVADQGCTRAYRRLTATLRGAHRLLLAARRGHGLAHEPERRLEIDWQEAQGERFLVRLALEGNDRRGLYADVAAAVSATGTDIKSMDLRSSDGKIMGSVLVEVENLVHLQKIVKAARRVKGITEVARRERLTPE